MNKKELNREKVLTTHMLVINKELINLVQMLENPNQMVRVGAAIGARTEMITNLIKILTQDDKDYKKRVDDYIKDHNKQEKKNWEKKENQMPFIKQNYMG